MNTPVTVVIPLYNKGEYIARAIQSVLAQTHQHWRLIVVDDGSTDNSYEQAARFSDSRITLLQQQNAGPGSARNRGLETSDTPFIAFLDADDEWLPNFLSQAVLALNEHPECALWVCGQLRGSHQRPHTSLCKRAEVWRLPKNLATHDLKPNLDQFHTGAIVARRDILSQFGGFYDQNHCTYGEDVYLWLQVAIAHPVFRTPEPLALYHWEASELGVWHRDSLPPWPMVLDPHSLRKNCAPQNRPLLERYLAYYATLSARRLAAAVCAKEARQILWQYPQSIWLGMPWVRAVMEVAIAPLPMLQNSMLALQKSVRKWRASRVN